jgi:hypothetical protein
VVVEQSLHRGSAREQDGSKNESAVSHLSGSLVRVIRSRGVRLGDVLEAVSFPNVREDP